MKTLSRKQLWLDGEWQFQVDPTRTLVPEKISSWRTARVPAPFQALFPDLRNYQGVSWYQREFTLPEDWPAGLTYLCFGAVDYQAEVWVNGQRAGEHKGGYLPFEFEISKLLQAGTNQVTVRVLDPTQSEPEPGPNFREIPHGKQSWYGMLSGLWQSVYMEARPVIHIQRVRILAQAPYAHIQILIEPEDTREAFMMYELYDPNGQLVDQSMTNQVKLALRAPNTALWDIDQPNLYTLKISLSAGNKTDVIEETFGFREVEARDKRLWLNGRPIYLRAALDQDYYPDLICTPPSLKYIEDQFRKARTMGLNCLRIHIKVADPRYYLAADRVGILIWSELPNWQLLTEKADQEAHDTLAEMVERDWNHPSIIIWSIINEAWGIDMTNVEHRNWLLEMYNWMKKLDSTRLVVDNSPCTPNFHVAGDLADYHYYTAIPEGMERWHQWVTEFTQRPSWLYGPKQLGIVPSKPDAPLIVSEFGNWGLPDFGRLMDYYQGEPWWFETGWDWSGGEVYPHGAVQRFKELYLDRVFGDITGLAQAAQWSQFEALKFEIEVMRLYPQIQGYVITEFTDCHWESNGLLDMLRNPKAYFERLPEINADMMLIPWLVRRSYWCGETIDVSVFLSHDRNPPVLNLELKWSLTAEGGELASGLMESLAVHQPALSKIANLAFEVPQVQRPVKASLKVALLGPQGDQMAASSLEVNLFPKPENSLQVACLDIALEEVLSKAGYQVAHDWYEGVPMILSELDGKALRSIQKGGRALLLAETPDVDQVKLHTGALKPRAGSPWSGDWLGTFSWYRKDLFGKSLPSNGRLDFSFAPVMPDVVITSVRTPDFEEAVLAGMFSGWLRRPAAFVQRLRIGRGTLLVSTFKLKDYILRNPLAEALLLELISVI